VIYVDESFKGVTDDFKSSNNLLTNKDLLQKLARINTGASLHIPYQLQRDYVSRDSLIVKANK
jgi:hypothetical protein